MRITNADGSVIEIPEKEPVNSVQIAEPEQKLVYNDSVSFFDEDLDLQTEEVEFDPWETVKILINLDQWELKSKFGRTDIKYIINNISYDDILKKLYEDVSIKQGDIIVSDKINEELGDFHYFVVLEILPDKDDDFVLSCMEAKNINGKNIDNLTKKIIVCGRPYKIKSEWITDIIGHAKDIKLGWT